jgi:serine/threonine-protein kinase
MADQNQTSGGTVISTEPPRSGATPPPLPNQPSQGMNLGSDLTGTTLLGRYKVLKKLGEGGMGTVYLGEHITIKKKFAIKVLSAEFAHKPDLVERFLQEARAASMISQENVVEITDFGDTPDGSVFFVMEFLDGEDLSDTIKNEGALPWHRVKSILGQVCRALSSAHAAGIIHRDMKPENCFRVKRGKNPDFIKVLDFGIAKVTSEEGEGSGKGLTRTGMIFGTPEYMSPEQAQGAKPDHRVDVYAVGVIMYELLTGRVPFTADTFMGILTKHMFEVPEAPTTIAPDAQIPPEVEAIILKAMQKDREYRFQDMDEMGAALETVGTGAAAVEVINENIARPTSGQMEFSGAVPGAGTAPPMFDEPQKNNMPLIIGIVGGLALIGAGAGLFVALGGDGDEDAVAAADDATPTAEAAVEGPKEEIAPAPVEEEEPEVKQLSAAAPKVKLSIKTNIEAHIIDAADGGSFGKTNGDPVEVEKSKDELELVLRAEGYDDYELNLKPTRNKTYDVKLIKSPTAKPKRKSTGKKKKGTTAAKATIPVPIPTPDKKEKPKKKKSGKSGLNSPDLKDPFKRGN